MNARLQDAVYAAGWRVVRGLPEPIARRQFDAIADAAWMRHGRSVQRLESNLRRVLGPRASARELHRTTHLGMRSYLRYWCEVFQMPRMRTEDLVARMECEDEWRLRDAVKAGRGMILALPHTGNWDHAGAWLAGTGVPFTTVAERLEPASLFDRFVAFRESLGMEVIPLTGGERAPYDVLADRLRAGGTLCLLSDRDLTATGVDVEFFDATARMPAGPAALAHDTGAALLPTTLHFPDRHRSSTRIHPQIEVPTDGDRAAKIRRMTQQLADAFAVAIAEHPQDWHMLQRIWVDDLDPDRLSSSAVTV
ncbi:MAG: phosphatidylinositol dimannoside acyltransferase [Frankiaceae bacterium]|jgi:KDO2-lipid IV(A) lauroyltransferase|nr:phosphatidylinositol dimannoside acyltransferase [Frankiaceae bacterium]